MIRGRLLEEARLRLEESRYIPLLVSFATPDWRPGEGLSRHLISKRSQLETMLSSPHVTIEREYATLPFLALTVDETGLEEIAAMPGIGHVELDDVFYPSMASSNPVINADDAWAAGHMGDDQIVVVMDTGVDTGHSFFTSQPGKVLAEACFSNGNILLGYQSFCPNGGPTQTGAGTGANCDLALAGCDHGTHVAGSAVGDDGSGPNYGVAREAHLIPIQVFVRATIPNPDEITARESDLVAALDHVFAIRNDFGSRTIASVNMSLGGGSYQSEGFCTALNPFFDAAAEQLVDAGIAVIASSGNDGQTDEVGHPACIDSILSVGATADDDSVASFSNVAGFLDFFAPGVDIRSASAGGGTTVKNGTSMAAPHVAGAWAVLRELAPGATVAELAAAFSDSGVPVDDSRTLCCDGGVCTPCTGVENDLPRIDLFAAIGELPDSSMLVLLDRTGSMDAIRPSTGNSRCADALALAKQDVETFFAEGGDAAAVWTFKGGSASNLTGGFVGEVAAMAALDGLSPSGCSSQTPLAEAICDASDELIQRPGGRILAISSDGGENSSSGACSGPNSFSGPPYDPNSWQRKVRDKVAGANVVFARFWGAVQRGQSVDVETGETRNRGALTDAGFFEDLATVTSGSFQNVADDDPLPTPFLGPFFDDGFESGSTSAWSGAVGLNFSCLNLPNAGFEASPSALSGWTQVEAGSGGWSVQSGGFSPESGFLVPSPPQGSQAAMSDQGAPGSHILYMDVDLPATPAALSFELFVGNREGVWYVPFSGTLSHLVTPNQHVRVDVMRPTAPVNDVGAGVLMNVLRKGPGDPAVSGYDRVTADLSAFAGQRIRLRFAEVDTEFFLQMGVDDVRICRRDLILRAADRRETPPRVEGGNVRQDADGQTPVYGQKVKPEA